MGRSRTRHVNKNVGGLDRLARLIVGPLLVLAAIAAYTGYLAVGVVVGALSLVAGAILLVTGTTQKCPANELAGVDTTDD